jgi:hypothetical protein
MLEMGKVETEDGAMAVGFYGFSLDCLTAGLGLRLGWPLRLISKTATEEVTPWWNNVQGNADSNSPTVYVLGPSY